MERKLVLELSNGRVLEGQISETETLTSHRLQFQTQCVRRIKILFTIPWKVLHKGHHYCFKIFARTKTSPPLLGRKSHSRLKSLSPELFMSAPYLCCGLKPVTISCKAQPNSFLRATLAKLIHLPSNFPLLLSETAY